ncbi:hypothetical protein ACTXT7_008779 [Hymenolepis weldensis]
MRPLYECHSLPLLSLVLLSFTVLQCYGLPTSLPLDMTSSAFEQQISSQESSGHFATFQTTPMVTLNDAEIPMKVVPLEEMGSRYFSYLTEGPPTTLKVEATTSAPQIDINLIKVETTDSKISKPLEEIKSTSASPTVMTGISTTSSIETTEPQELSTKLEYSEGPMVSTNDISDNELKSVSTLTASPPLLTATLMISFPETSESQDLITTTVTTPIITNLHVKDMELLTTERSDPQIMTTLISTPPIPEISGTVQTSEFKETTSLVTTSSSTQESAIIISENGLITATSSSTETPSVITPISTSLPVEITMLLSTSAPVKQMASSVVPSDPTTNVALSTTPTSVISTQIMMDNVVTPIETTRSASTVQEQITIAKVKDTALQEVTTIPIAAATSAVTEKIQERTPISSRIPEVSTVKPVLSTKAALFTTNVEAHIVTTAQPLTSTKSLAQTTQNVQSTPIATTASKIFDKTSSTAGVISKQTTENVSLTIAPLETSDKIPSAIESSSAFLTEGPAPIATEIENNKIVATVSDVITTSKPEEIAASIITTLALPTVQTTQSAAASGKFWKISAVSAESIKGNVATAVTTEPPKAELIITEIVKSAEILTTTSSPAESTANNANNITDTSTQMVIVTEATTGSEPETSKLTTIATEKTTLVIPEVIITSTSVAGENITEIPPNTLRSVTQVPTVLEDSDKTTHSIPGILSTASITAVTETTLLSNLPQSTTSSSPLPDEVEIEVPPIALSSVISETVSTGQSITITPVSSDSVLEVHTSSESPIVSDTTQLQALSPTSPTTIAVAVTRESSLSRGETEATTSTTNISLKDVDSTVSIEWTGIEAQSTSSVEITKTIQSISSTSQPTKEDQLQPQPPALPTSIENMKTTAQTGQVPGSPPHEKPEITTVEITTVVPEVAAMPEHPIKAENRTAPPNEITTKELIHTTQALQPAITEKPLDPIKPAVDPSPQRPKDPDSEGMTLATAISMGLILIFLLILLCILAVSLIAGWIHCRRRDRQPKVSLIRVERGLATEFADSWSKGMSAQAWMTTQSGATTMNPIPSTSSPQSTIQPLAPPQSQKFHCGCKRRGLFRRANRLCMVHGNPSARHPTSTVRAVKIISLSDNSDGEGADTVLLTELGRRRASGASNALGGEEEEDSRDIGKGRGEWLFIDEA